MKDMNSIIGIACLLMLSIVAHAQEDNIGQLFLGNNEPGNAVLLKWITPEFGAKEGFQVYRQPAGETDWTLLTAAPIKKMTTLKLNPVDRDEAIDFLEDYIQNNNLSKADPFTLLLLSKKLVELNDFAKYLGLFYQDTTAQSGQTYRYQVTKLEKGKERLVGTSAAITVKPYEPIAPPQGIEVFVDEKIDTTVNVFWTPEETRYFAINIYRTEEGKQSEKINPNPAIPSQSRNAAGKLIYPKYFYQKGDHALDRKYIYELRAIDFFGRESQVSPPLEIEIIDRTPPPPPSNLETVRIGPQDVLVSWAGSDAENIVGYDVMVSDSIDGVFYKANRTTLSANQTTFEYELTGEDWGDRFFYIEAINALGSRSASTKMGLTVNDVIPPTVPTGVVATPYEGAIKISWDEQSEPDLFGFVVYRSVANNPGAPYVLASGGSILGNTFLDSLPREARNKYFYKVAAIDLSGNLGKRSEPVSAVMPDVIPPIAPTIINLKIKGDTALISWLPSIDDELKGYHLYRSSEIDTAKWSLIGGKLISPINTQYADIGLSPDFTYYYQLTAEDLTGNISKTSNRYTVKTNPDYSVENSPAKLKVNYNKRKKATLVSWPLNKSKTVEGSILYRKVENGRFFPISDLLTDSSEYTDQDIIPEKTYSYQLRTYYKDGKISRSEPVEISTQ